MSSLTFDQRRAIDRSKEQLVPAAEKLLDEAAVTELDPKDFGHAQLRNLIAVAMETESPAVVVNFIKYQIGRDSHQRDWASVHAGKSLGERLIDELQKPGCAIDKALETIEGLEGDLARQLVRIELIRHYLGFASRYLKYLDLKRGKKGGKP